jgi:hypothetical protein
MSNKLEYARIYLSLYCISVLRRAAGTVLVLWLCLCVWCLCLAAPLRASLPSGGSFSHLPGGLGDGDSEDGNGSENGDASEKGNSKPIPLPGSKEELEEKEKHQLKHRELFLSRQVETLPATHIRGKCAVTLLNETESLLSYLNKDVS